MRSITLLIIVVTIISCSEKDMIVSNNGSKSSEVQFNLGEIADNLAKASDVNDIAAIIVDIEDDNGSSVYNSYKVGITNFNSEFISSPVTFAAGTGYKLTQFLVVDDSDSVLYATPQEGSSLAHLVNTPLDITFDVAADTTGKVVVEVVEVGGFIASDFGYTTFSLNIVDVIESLVNVFIYDYTENNYISTSANISIYGDSSEIYSGVLISGENKIVVNNGFNTYRLVVTKNGYNSYSEDFTASELANYENTPLLITLQETVDTYTKLLLLGEGEHLQNLILDSSESPKTLTVYGDVVTDTTRKKHGVSSIYFDGAGDYIEMDDSEDYNFESGDFTIDFWVKRNEVSSSSQEYFFGQGDSLGRDTSNSVGICVTEDNTLRYFIRGVDSTYLYYSNTVIDDTTLWHHIALIRNNETVMLFIDGVLEISFTITGSLNNSINKLSIGRYGEHNGLYFNGYIDNFRISKGIARWTSNFTP